MSHGWLHRLRSSGTGLAFLAGLLLAGVLHLPNFSSAQQPSAPAVSTRPTAPAGAATLANLSEAFASVAEHVKPSVVFIKSGKTERAQGPRMQIPPGMEQFFPRLPQQGPDDQRHKGAQSVDKHVRFARKIPQPLDHGLVEIGRGRVLPFLHRSS